MSLFDYYIPHPALACPICGRRFSEWIGYDGPCGLMVWQQGLPAPVGQRVSEDARLLPADLASRRLPTMFLIGAERCCSDRFGVEAIGSAPGGVWSSTALVTAENARQRKNERRGEYKARLAWLRGGAA